MVYYRPYNFKEISYSSLIDKSTNLDSSKTYFIKDVQIQIPKKLMTPYGLTYKGCSDCLKSYRNCHCEEGFHSDNIKTNKKNIKHRRFKSMFKITGKLVSSTNKIDTSAPEVTIFESTLLVSGYEQQLNNSNKPAEYVHKRGVKVYLPTPSEFQSWYHSNEFHKIDEVQEYLQDLKFDCFVKIPSSSSKWSTYTITSIYEARYCDQTTTLNKSDVSIVTTDGNQNDELKTPPITPSKNVTKGRELKKSKKRMLIDDSDASVNLHGPSDSNSVVRYRKKQSRLDDFISSK